MLRQCSIIYGIKSESMYRLWITNRIYNYLCNDVYRIDRDTVIGSCDVIRDNYNIFSDQRSRARARCAQGQQRVGKVVQLFHFVHHRSYN